MERKPLLKSPSRPRYHSCYCDSEQSSNPQRHDPDKCQNDAEEARSGATRAATNCRSIQNNDQATLVPVLASSSDASSPELKQRRENHVDNIRSCCCYCPYQNNKEQADASEHKETIPQAKVVKDKRKSLLLLTVIAFLCSCASMIHSPVMEQYVYQVFTQEVFGNLSTDIHVNKEPCVNSTNSSVEALKTRQVQDQSGDFQAYLTMIDGGIAIVVNLFLGAYSDMLGRKLSLFLPIFGHFLRNSAAPIIIYFDFGLPGMYVGYILDGLFGGYLGILAGMYAYSADISEKGSQRNVSVTLVAVSIGMAQCLLGVLAGVFILETGFFLPALVSSLLLLVAAFLVFILPETMPRDRKAHLSPLQMLKHIFRTFFPSDDSLRRAMLLLGLVGFFLSTFPEVSSATLDALYLMKEPFCWSSLQQGILTSARDTSSYVAAFTVIRLLTKVVSDPLLSIMGLVSEIGRCVSMALAKNGLTVYVGVVSTGILRRAIYAPMRAFMSSLVDRDRQGALFAGIAVMECVSEFLGKKTMVGVYNATMTFMPGFVFLVVAAANFAPTIVFAINWRLLRKFKASRVIVLSIQEPDKDKLHEREQQQQPATATTR